ncbi:MAG: hypothetical protein HOP11_08200 [Saprospiraceae bacterium]|nr:hypothetical protein [Saprospiraceae bacterium]
MSQTQKIKKDLESGKKITPIMALSKYGTLRLAARINDIRNLGLNVRTKIIHKGTKSFAQYSI